MLVCNQPENAEESEKIILTSEILS